MARTRFQVCGFTRLRRWELGGANEPVYQSILNYSTEITVKQTVEEITNLLSSAHTSAILSEYNHGNLLAISFRIQTEFGLVSFRMPANVEGVFGVLARSERIPKKFRTREQASCVAWRIVKEWLEVQLAMVQAGLVKFEQVFLPYAQDPKTGQTVYEQLKEKQFSSLALTEGKK